MSTGRRNLRILHLFANFKWTGPADPAIRAAVHLRRQGADVVFAQAQWQIPGAEHRMRAELKRARLPVIAGLELRKHFQLRSCLRDAKELRRRLQRGDFDVLHTHLLADHLIAALAKRRAPGSVVVVRSLYEPQAPRRGWRQLLAMHLTDGVVAPTRQCAEQVASRFGFAADRVLYQEPPTEPAPPGEGNLRGELGFAPDDLVVGITARIQPHRRFDLLWQTARIVADRQPRARFVLLGRGNPTDVRRLVREPIERLGLQHFVRLPGYLQAPQYESALRAFDAFLFLVPGSDGTCRAVREAMAHGLPVVATRRGMLPELLSAGVSDGTPPGVVADEDPESLAVALEGVLVDPELRRRMGASAAARAVQAMDPTRAAQELLAFYERLVGAVR